MNPVNRYRVQKQCVLDACLVLSDAGYLAGTGGNLALRLEENLFAVTPSGADYFALDADSICVLRMSDLKQVEGDLKPSVESAMHAALLRSKPHMQASVHTHQPLASAVALLGTDLPLTDAADRRELGERIALVGYAPSGTGFLVRNLTRTLSTDVHGYLLKNHGVICAARDMHAAIANVARIESIAAEFLKYSLDPSRLSSATLRALVLGALPTREVERPS